jgi:phage regulator Rha-like protein
MAILDSDVAKIYGVETKRVNEAVKNNPRKFPNEEYIFRLNINEFNEIKALIANSQQADIQQPVENFDRLLNIKNIAEVNVFTEKGLYMLATILKSDRAIDATLEIVEAFAKMRELSRNIAILNSMDSDVIEPEIVESTGDLIKDLFFSNLPTTSSETSLEFNVGVVKGKRTIKSDTSTGSVTAIQNELDALKKRMEQLENLLRQ